MKTPTEREALLKELSKWIGWTNTTGYSQLGYALRQAIDMLEADAKEIARLNSGWNTANVDALEKAQQVAVPQVEFLQFLSDVHTAAGLVEHGRQCKDLGSRLSKMVMRLYAAAPQPPQQAIDALEANQPVNFCVNAAGEKSAMITSDPLRFDRNASVITLLREAIAAPEPPQPVREPMTEAELITAWGKTYGGMNDYDSFVDGNRNAEAHDNKEEKK